MLQVYIVVAFITNPHLFPFCRKEVYLVHAESGAVNIFFLEVLFRHIGERESTVFKAPVAPSKPLKNKDKDQKGLEFTRR
jgi:hypothetical protein